MSYISPYPYKLSSGGELINGAIFNAPKFCIRNKQNPQCKKFYRSLKKRGEYTCPYGFGVNVVDIKGKDVILTCLNVESVSKKKEVQKRLGVAEFIPRLPYDEYKKVLTNFLQTIGETSILDESYSIERRQAFLQEQQEILDDTLHEIRKLNSQLKETTRRLTSALSYIRNPTEQIESLNLDVYSITNLMSIRLDAYDLQVNPELNLDSGKRPIAIYKKVEKVYKCLRSAAQKRNINIRLNGASHNQFNATNAIEIALFIIIDNAIKYSPNGKEISINFYESDDTLTLNIKNLGICPADHEKATLFHRGVRSKYVESIEGRGLGLYLLKQICETNDIKLGVKIDSREHYFENGIRYAPFTICLEFNHMLITEVDG